MTANRILPLVCLLLASCASGDLAIREVGTVHKDASDGTTNGRVAIGLGQLGMGNIGLALETFRRAAREDPTSAEALAGMAECYQRMGRPQLARQYLEQALALRPQDPGLYRALAVVEDSEGNTAQAASLRREATLRAEGKTAAIQRVTITLPPPAPAPVETAVAFAPVVPVETHAPAASVTIALPAPRPTPAPAPEPATGPRLVRLSMGEVMLVTGARTPFAATRMASDDTIHAPLRVLNAARIQGIAARTRTLLAARGVTGIEIGDAPTRQASSELRYPMGQHGRAQIIAARLPFPVRLVESGRALVLLVGRDAGRRA